MKRKVIIIIFIQKGGAWQLLDKRGGSQHEGYVKVTRRWPQVRTIDVAVGLTWESNGAKWAELASRDR